MNDFSLNAIRQAGYAAVGEKQEKERPKSPEEVLQLIRTAQDAVSPLRDKVAVLVTGETGAGKSTFINFMAGCEQAKDVLKGKIIVRSRNPIAPEGHGRPSKTCYPNVYPVGQPPLNLCDCPGFSDNRGNAIEIANAASLAQLAKTCRKVKCVILCVEYSTTSSERGAGLEKAIRATTDFLGNRALIKSVFLLFTKAILQDGISPKAMLEGVAEESPAVNYLYQMGNVGFYFPIGPHLQDPLVYNRDSIRRKIEQFEEITEPRNHFNMVLDPKANSYIASCIEWGGKEVISLINKKDSNGFLKLPDLLNSLYVLKELTARDPQIVGVFQSFEETLLTSIERLRYDDLAVSYLENLARILPENYVSCKKAIAETLQALKTRILREQERAKELKSLTDSKQQLEEKAAQIAIELKNQRISREEAEKKNAELQSAKQSLEERAEKIKQEKDAEKSERTLSEQRWAKAGEFFGSLLGAFARAVSGIPIQSRL